MSIRGVSATDSLEAMGSAGDVGGELAGGHEMLGLIDQLLDMEGYEDISHVVFNRSA